MKKIIFGFVAIVMLSIVFPLSSLAATTNNGDGTFTLSGKIDNLDNKTVTITVFKGKEQISENLMFIDEIQGNEAGNYNHTFSTKEALSVDEPFYVKVAVNGKVVEENAIYHPDAKPEDGDNGENPDEGNDGEDPGENPGEEDKEDPEKPGEDNNEEDPGDGSTPGSDTDDTDKDDTGKNQPGDQNGQNDNKNNEGKQPSDKSDEDGKLLPITATNIFTILLVGLILVGVGAILLKRKRNSVTE